MRWRFIGVAMLSVVLVMVLLVVTISLITFKTVTAQQDQTAAAILEMETRSEEPPNGTPVDLEPFHGFGWMGTPSKEMQFSTRFFAVHCDLNGNVLSTTRDYIASVSESQAAEYAQGVLAGKDDSGYIGEYRYAMTATDSEVVIVFVNSARELQMVRYVILISAMVAMVTLLLIFALVILLSKRAILPYIRNLEMQKRFITDAGHEIKTPLTSIATSADVLAMEHENDEWVENIQKQSVRLTKLVNNLVTLSHLDEATPFPEKTVFSLSEAAWEASEPFASMAKAKGKEFVQEIQENLEINGDKNAVQQMISILLDNALRYSDDCGKIRFEVCGKNKHCCISVYNTCAPIRKEDLAHLFDRFYRPDQSRSTHTGGTGIGLSIAKATAEGHGGKITVKAPDEHSICFTVIL